MVLTKQQIVKIVYGIIALLILFYIISDIISIISRGYPFDEQYATKETKIEPVTRDQQAQLSQSIVQDSIGTGNPSMNISPEAEIYIAELNAQAEADNENAERFFSPDMNYAAYVSETLNPFVQEEIIQGTYTKEISQYINGINLIDQQTGQIKQLVVPGCKDIRDYITNMEWSLESDVIFFTSGNVFASSYGVYRCDVPSGKITRLSDGFFQGLILDSPYIGFVKVMKSCFVEGKGGRHWYLAAISPDGKNEVRLSEPSLNMPED